MTSLSLSGYVLYAAKQKTKFKITEIINLIFLYKCEADRMTNDLEMALNDLKMTLK